MAAFYIILASLLAYPIVSYFIVRITKDKPKSRKRIILSLSISSILIVLACIFHIITISQRLNWILVTSIYLTISTLLWLTQFKTNNLIRIPGLLFILIVFGAGYFASTFGILFTPFAASDLDTDQRIWLTNDLIYKENNIGIGPDPSVREKNVEIYKTVFFFPILAKRIKVKVYDEWNLSLQRNLNVSFSKEKKVIELSSLVHGLEKREWHDTIDISELYIR